MIKRYLKVVDNEGVSKELTIGEIYECFNTHDDLKLVFNDMGVYSWYNEKRFKVLVINWG